jgi:hypothetical protein
MVRGDPTVIPYSASPGQAAAKVSSGWRLEIAASTMLPRGEAICLAVLGQNLAGVVFRQI